MHPDHVDAVSRALFQPDQFDKEPSAGRGNVYRFDIEGGQGIVRQFRRGGLIKHIIHNGYLLDNRPLRELKIWCHALESGIAVPIPLGAAWRKKGPLYFGAIATAYLDSQHLQDVLNNTPSTDILKPTLTRCGEAIRAMHDSGIVHADLQVRNILITPDQDPYLIDFDNAKHVTRISDIQRHRNLLRLKRSFDKNNLHLAAFDTICQAYGIESLPKTLSLLYSAKGKASNAFSHTDSDKD